MAFAMRRCMLNVRNLEKCRTLYMLPQNDGLITQHFSNNNSEECLREIHIKRRAFHTSLVSNKIVAFKLSDIGEGIREVVIKEWFVKEGDKVQQFDNICEVQSDKASVTITSRYDGVVTKLYHEIHQIALVGYPLVDIEVEGENDGIPSTAEENKPKENPTAVAMENKREKVLTTPAVRRIAAQYKVDLSAVTPTGKNRRLMKEDLLAHLNITSDKSNEVPDFESVQAVGIPVQSAQAKTEVLLEDKIVPVSGFTKAMVKSMTEAMKIPHFGYSDEYDVTNLVETRATLKELAQKQNVKLTYMPIIVKAVSLSLGAYPILNSSLDNKCECIVYKANHNIGVAMDTPNGLVVPVIKNVQKKTILDIARELNSFQEMGSKGQLGLSDLSDGTFTISNIGMIGGTYTKPVILPPQVSIGALGKIQLLPRFDSEGNVTKAHILTVSWSADHRIVDGVTMARFSNHLKKYLENPYTLLLDL